MHEGITRVVGFQLDLALSALERMGDEVRVVDAGVHEVRRTLKRVRALLRLVRSGIRKRRFRSEIRQLGEAGRQLSAVRDASVLVETARLVRSVVAPSLRGDAIKLTRRLGRRRGRLLRSVLGQGGSGDAVAVQLRAASDGLPDWRIRGGRPVIEAGLRASYAAGRAQRRRAARRMDGEVHHKWRKRAKDLRHQLEFLQGAWPALLGASTQEMHRLTDLLGVANDITVLLAALERDDGLTRGLGEPADLAAAAAAERGRLWAEAGSLGRRLYAEQPGVFTVRLGSYWSAWRA